MGLVLMGLPPLLLGLLELLKPLLAHLLDLRPGENLIAIRFTPFALGHLLENLGQLLSVSENAPKFLNGALVLRQPGCPITFSPSKLLRALGVIGVTRVAIEQLLKANLEGLPPVFDLIELLGRTLEAPWGSGRGWS